MKQDYIISEATLQAASARFASALIGEGILSSVPGINQLKAGALIKNAPVAALA